MTVYRFTGGPWDGEEHEVAGGVCDRLDVVKLTDEKGDIHTSLYDYWLEEILPHGCYRWCRDGSHLACASSTTRSPGG